MPDRATQRRSRHGPHNQSPSTTSSRETHGGRSWYGVLHASQCRTVPASSPKPQALHGRVSGAEG